MHSVIAKHFAKENSSFFFSSKHWIFPGLKQGGRIENRVDIFILQRTKPNFVDINFLFPKFTI